jgi:hypothetical protein
VIAVGVAGAIAIGANIGILDASNASNVGTLAASGDITPPATQVVDVYVTSPSGAAAAVPSTAGSAAGAPSAATIQEFAVDAAGSVGLAADGGALRVDHVRPADGWTWQLMQLSPAQLTLTFTNGSTMLDLTASAAADGAITADVATRGSAPAPAVATEPSGGSSGEGAHEGGGDDD